MRALVTLAALGLFAGLLAACNNAIYFYETEKVSLTLEGRPDATSPVSGSFGIKQRVVAFGPPKKEGTSSAGEDAVSMISYFAFNKTDIGRFHDPIVIETALITGDAALGLDGAESGAAFDAFSSFATEAFTDSMALGSLAYTLLEDRDVFTTDAEASAIKADLDRLAGHVPDLFDFQRFTWAPPDLRIRDLTVRVDGTGFVKVCRYRGELVESIRNIEAALGSIAASGAAGVTVNGHEPGFDVSRILQSALTEQRGLLRGRDQLFGASNAVQRLLEYHARSAGGP